MTTKKRVPSLPGVNADVPPGGKGIVASAGYLGRKRLTKAISTFENGKGPDELEPYEEAADEWLKAAAAQLGMTFGQCGPMELAILRGAADQMLWAQVFFDRARTHFEDGKDPRFGEIPKLVESASRITDSYRANILAANTLRAQHAAREGAAAPVDPLAKFREALPVSSTNQTHSSPEETSEGDQTDERQDQ